MAPSKFRTVYLLSFMSSTLCSSVDGRTPSDPNPVSTSIDGLRDYSHTFPFVDVVKQSRPCGSAKAPYDGDCVSDPSGWPTQDFGYVLITTDSGPPPPSGTGTVIAGIYTVIATGNATIMLDDTHGTVLNSSYNANTNTLTAYVNCTSQGGNFWLGFINTSRDPKHTPEAKGLTDVKVLQPGYGVDSADAFTDEFIRLVSRFDSLRFMDWRATNNNPETVWGNRSQVTDASYVSPMGIPWEICAKLANQVQRDMWINIPARANDDYITQLGVLLAKSVDPSLNIYFEYSNEVWNWQFSQAHYSLAAANTSVLNDGDPYHLNYDNCSNVGYWQWRRTAYEAAVRIPKLFETGFGVGNVGPSKRVRPIFSGQASSPFVINNGLDYLEQVFGSPGLRLHGLAVAPYFNLGEATNDPNLDLDGILSAMAANVKNQSVAAGVGITNPTAQHAAMARYHGLQLRAYEGGPDTMCPYSGPNQGCSKSNLAARAQSSIDPRLTPMIVQYLQDWASWGPMMGPLNYFVAGATPLLSKYGIYGLLYDMTVPVTPKSKAVDSVRAAPRPSPSSDLPSLPIEFYNASNYAGHTVPIRDARVEYERVNSTYYYLVRTGANSGGLRVTAVVSSLVANLPLEISVSSLPGSATTVNVTTQGKAFNVTTPALFPNYVKPNDVISIRIRNLVDHGYSISGFSLEVV